MKKILATIVSGYMGLLFPLVMTIILLEKLHHLIYPVVEAIENKLHISRVLGVMGIILISVVFMIFLGYLSGLLIKTPFIKKEVSRFEEAILGKIPLYNLLKSVFGTQVGVEDKNVFRPALLTDEKSFSLCYVTSESENFYTLYVSEGGLSGGELKIVPKDTVRLLNIGLAEFTRLIKQYGVNSAQYAEQFLKK